MNSPTPFLEDIIILCMLIFPSSLVSIIPKPKVQSFRFMMLSSIAVYAVLILLTALVKQGQILFLNNAPIALYFIAPLVGILCLVIEFLIGALQGFIKHGKFPKGLAVHSFFAPKISIADISFIIILVICEELIMRQTFFSILLTTFGMEIWLIIISCAVVYGLNHIYFGLAVVPQKIASGIIYASLYYLSGMSLFIPVIAHVTQNLSLMAFSKWKGPDNSGLDEETHRPNGFLKMGGTR